MNKSISTLFNTLNAAGVLIQYEGDISYYISAKYALFVDGVAVNNIKSSIDCYLISDVEWNSTEYKSAGVVTYFIYQLVDELMQ